MSMRDEIKTGTHGKIMSDSSTKPVTQSGLVTVTELDHAIWSTVPVKKSSIGSNSPANFSFSHHPEASSASHHVSAAPAAASAAASVPLAAPKIKNDMNSVFCNPTFWAFVAMVIAGLVFLKFGVHDELAPDSIEAFDKNFEVLGLSISASDDDVKKRFKELAKKYHPDKCQTDECAENYLAANKAKEAILKHGAFWKAQRVINANKIPTTAGFSQPGKKPKAKPERKNPWEH